MFLLVRQHSPAMQDWKEFRRNCLDTSLIIDGAALHHSTTAPKSGRVILFTPASCYFREYDTMPEALRNVRLENTAACLQRCLSGHAASNPLMYGSKKASFVPTVMWNSIVTDVCQLRGGIEENVGCSTVVVVVPDRNPSDLDHLHQQMSTAARLPTFAKDVSELMCTARVRGLPCVSRVATERGSHEQRQESKVQSPSRQAMFVSIEYLMASLHFGVWCEPDDYLLTSPFAHTNAITELPDWKYLRAQCPSCVPDVMTALGSIRSLAEEDPKPHLSDESGKTTAKRLRGVSADESLQLLRQLSQLAGWDTTAPLLLGSRSAASTTRCAEVVPNLTDCEGLRAAANAFVPSDDVVGWLGATAPPLLTQTHFVATTACGREGSEFSWVLPNVLSASLQGLLHDTAVESAVDESLLSVDERRMLRTVVKYSSALHRCFHSATSSSATSNSAQVNGGQQPLEMVWVAIGEELGISGSEALSRFTSLRIQHRSATLPYGEHMVPLSPTAAAELADEPLELLRKSAALPCAEVMPDAQQQQDSAEGNTYHSGPAALDDHDSSYSLEGALQFRFCLARIHQVLSHQSEALDKVLLWTQQALLTQLKHALQTAANAEH